MPCFLSLICCISSIWMATDFWVNNAMTWEHLKEILGRGALNDHLINLITTVFVEQPLNCPGSFKMICNVLAGAYNMSSLPTGCCAVQWAMLKGGGPYLPWQALQFRELSAARLLIGHTLTKCPPIGQVVCNLG